MAQDAARAFHAIVHGHVQGVGFRWSAVREARSLGLRGTVSNRFDGDVEVVAEGDEQRLLRFAAWLKKGPPGAHVRDIDLEWVPATGSYGDFEVDF